MTNNVSRREFVKLVGATSLLAVLPKSFRSAHSLKAITREWITTGYEIPELVSFDNTMRDFMQARNVSGGALAVTRNSKLVLARGYTYSDDYEDIIVQPTSLFRIASISKPITATAVLRLVQDNQLDLSAKLTVILTLTPPSGQTPDPRLSDITVLNLLQHLGGWDREISFYPMRSDFAIAGALGVSLPISKTDIATYMTGQALQHTPGTTYAYSNYGYSLVGQIIEQITGQAYQDYVNQKVFRSLEVTQTQLGRTLPEFRLSNEVKYHSQYGGTTVFDNTGSVVPQPYGAFNVENYDSHGGWLASAVDLARFASTFDDPSTSPVLSQSSVNMMFALPENIDPGDYVPGHKYYACGWEVRDWGSGFRNTWHGGSLSGTHTLMVRLWDGLNWCVLFNQRDDPSGLPYGEIDNLLHAAADAVSSWPDHDLFDEYLLRERVYLPIIIK